MTDSQIFLNNYPVAETNALPVAVRPMGLALASGNITGPSQAVSVNVSDCSLLNAHLVATDLVGHNVTFEGSIDSTDGANGAWFAVPGVRSGDNTIELTSGVLAATPAYAWRFNTNGLAYFRVRSTAHTSGTAAWKFKKGAFAADPNPASSTTAAVNNISKQRFPSTKELTYTGDLLTQIDETIDGVTWRTTLTYAGDVLTDVSVVQI